MTKARATYERSRLIFPKIKIEVESAPDRSLVVDLPGFALPALDRPVDLWSNKASSQFRAAFAGSRLVSHLDDLMMNVREPFRLAIGGDKAASIPWEAFQRELREVHRAKFAPIRLLNSTPASHFRAVPDKMRVLLLVGDPGQPSGASSRMAFDPDAAANYLEQAIVRAAAFDGSCLAAEAIKVVQLRVETFGAAAEVAARHRPNVVLYFGHGRHDGAPQILLGKDEGGWVTLSDVVRKVFPDDAARPPFWIFWACALAKETTQPRLRIDVPDVLGPKGVLGAVSVLAMRSEISPTTASVMIEALFEAFAAGEPLDIAAAAARAAALAVATEDTERMDFAAPAVWSRSERVDRLSWGASTTFPIKWIALPLLGDGGRLPDLATGHALVGDDVGPQAIGWSQPGRMFVVAAQAVATEAALRARFFTMGAGIRQQTRRAVIPIFLNAGPSFESKLAFWAAAVQGELDPRHHDSAVVTAFELLKSEPLYGLQFLLGIPDLVVMLSEPPSKAHQWRALDDVSNTTTLIVFGTAAPPQALDWRFEQIGAEIMGALAADAYKNAFDKCVQKVPLALAVLLVSERPLTLDQVAEMAGTKTEALADLDGLLVRVGARRVLGQTVRTQLRQTLAPALLSNAHIRCIDRLMKERVDVDFAAAVEVVRHHLALGNAVKAAEVANACFGFAGQAWNQALFYQLFRIAAGSEEFRANLDSMLLLELAQAGISAHETVVVRDLLSGCPEPEHIADRARLQGLLHEAYKADAFNVTSLRRMRQCALEAMKLAELAGAAIVDERQRGQFLAPYKNNLARISQYFDHEFAAARRTYAEILTDVSGAAHENPVSGHIFVAASRNSAECLIDSGDPIEAGGTLDEIEQLLGDAQSVAARHNLHSARAEVLYSRARALERSGDAQAARACLSNILEDANVSQSPLVAAIVRDRLAWLEVRGGQRPFRYDELAPRLRALDLLRSHAWATRVAIKSRIRGAKALFGDGFERSIEQARELLNEALAIASDFHGLRGESDGRRAAQIFAGLQESEHGTHWYDFLQSPMSERVRAQFADRAPEDVWAEVQ